MLWYGRGGQKTIFVSQFSHSTMIPRDQTQLVRLDGKCVYPRGIYYLKLSLLLFIVADDLSFRPQETLGSFYFSVPFSLVRKTNTASNKHPWAFSFSRLENAGHICKGSKNVLP